MHDFRFHRPHWMLVYSEQSYIQGKVTDWTEEHQRGNGKALSGSVSPSLLGSNKGSLWDKGENISTFNIQIMYGGKETKAKSPLLKQG